MIEAYIRATEDVLRLADTEVGVRSVGGKKKMRFIDVVAIDPETNTIVEIHQVGRVLKSAPKVPVSRERAALRDLRHVPALREAVRFFHGYNL